jgi:hypothetical protein
VSVDVISVVIDVDVDLCGVPGEATVVGSEMAGDFLPVAAVDNVEVDSMVLNVDREELGPEVRYVRKARDRSL